jgi:hypothetical protein
MKTDWIKIKRKNIKNLITYYVTLLILGISIVVISLLFENINVLCPDCFSISLVSIMGSIGTALIGSTIYYLRKIYKSCINIEIEYPKNEEDYLKEIGALSYFYLRPIFAIVFALLIHISLKAGVKIITVKEARLSEGFIYLTMFMSFFVGFSAGDFLTYIQSKGKEIIEKVF